MYDNAREIKELAHEFVRGAKVRAISFAKKHHVMAGLDPAIKLILKDMCFLLLDGPIKSGHDKREFVVCRDFCPSYMNFPELELDQRRQLIDVQQRFEAWRQADRTFRTSYKGTMALGLMPRVRPPERFSVVAHLAKTPVTAHSERLQGRSDLAEKYISSGCYSRAATTN